MYAIAVISGVLLLLGLFASLNLAVVGALAVPAGIVCGISVIAAAALTRGSGGWRLVSGAAGALLLVWVLTGLVVHGVPSTVAEHPASDGVTTVLVKQGKGDDKYLVYLSSGSGVGRRERLVLDTSSDLPTVQWLDDSHLQVIDGDGRVVLAVGGDHVSTVVLSCQDSHTGICSRLR